MPIIDDDALANFTPYEAEAMLTRLAEIYKDGVSAREAVELHRVEKVLKARAGSQ